jgi:hypothetical protein
MNISSANSPAISGRGPVTKPVDKLFSEKAPEGSFTDTLQDVYYSKPADSKLLSEVTEQKQEKYKQLLGQAVADGHLTAEQAAQRAQTFETGSMGPYNAKQKTPPGAQVLDILQEMDNDQFCLIRHPQQCGDGLYRPMDFYISPGHLALKAAAQGWETSKDSDGTDIPVADVVVVGAGPGGLTTAWQMARRGGRVVCFESELAGSNFNDGGAKPVHHMRTSSEFTNLINEGHSAASLEHPLSLSGTLEVSRPHAKAGREGQTQLTGEVMHGVYPDFTENTSNIELPATRGELWNHLSNIAYSMANDFPDGVLCERSPVAEVKYGDDGLFEVTTTRGHKIKCKELVVSTGLTGPQGERAKTLSVLDGLNKSAPTKSIVMQKVGDGQANADELSDVARGKSKATLIVNDRLLGDQAFRQTFAAIPAGERAAMIGSGESGIKGALEMAHLNPNITIDLFVKGYMESAQVQVPSENFRQPVIEKTLENPEMANMLADMYKFFDTPVTPRSLQEVFELQSQGRIRLLELGQYFDEKSVKLTALEDGSTKLEINDPVVAERLAKSEQDYKSKGLLPQNESFTKPVTYRAFVQAPGYNKTPLSENPLAQLPKACHHKLHANSITSSVHPAQSALPGLGTAGRKLGEALAERLVPDDRRIEISVPSDRGTDYRNWSDDDVNAIITNIGGNPRIAEEIRKEIAETGSSPREYLLYLTSADPKLRSIAEKPESERTPAEKELLERGLHLGRRLYNAAPEIYKKIAS